MREVIGFSQIAEQKMQRTLLLDAISVSVL